MGETTATKPAIGDAYAAGFARGAKVGASTMAAYLRAALAPLTPEQKNFFRETREAAAALGLVEDAPPAPTGIGVSGPELAPRSSRQSTSMPFDRSTVFAASLRKNRKNSSATDR